MKYTMNEQNGYLEIICEKPVEIQDCCYDEKRDEYVIAVKHYKGKNYSVEYIVVNREGKNVKNLLEKQGVNPRFVLAPDKSLWIGMSSICTKKDGEIVLPLYERERVTKEIIKADVGVNYDFFWNGCHWGYVQDMWGDKPDKLLKYEFDKNELYKTRKTMKLEGQFGATPYVQDDVLYLCKRDFDEGIVRLFKMNTPEEIEVFGTSATVGGFTWCYLVCVDGGECVVIGVEENEIYRLRISLNGELLEKKCIFTLDDTMFYSIMDFEVTKDGNVDFSYVSEHQCGSIRIRKDVVEEIFKYKEEKLYCRNKEIASECKMAFHIMSDGTNCWHLGTNISATGSTCKTIYVSK